MHITVVNSASAQNLQNRMNSGNWIILYYADWCGFCQQFKPEWEALKSRMPAYINTAEAESGVIPQFPKPPVVQGYPTIKLYRNSQDLGDYQGARTSSDILEYLNKTMGMATGRSTMPKAIKLKMLPSKMIRESKRINELLKKTTQAKLKRVRTPTQAMRYLESTLNRSIRRNSKKTRKVRRKLKSKHSKKHSKSSA
jgi:thioredoxin-like negative regulator of GroEL